MSLASASLSQSRSETLSETRDDDETTGWYLRRLFLQLLPLVCNKHLVSLARDDNEVAVTRDGGDASAQLF